MSENQLGKDLKLIDKEIGVDLIPEINGDLATIDDDYNESLFETNNYQELITYNQ